MHRTTPDAHCLKNLHSTIFNTIINRLSLSLHTTVLAMINLSPDIRNMQIDYRTEQRKKRMLYLHTAP